MGSQWTRSCLRGLPGRQAALLPAEQNASCTDKPPFLSVSLALYSYEPVPSHSHTPLCVCACVCVLNTYMCSHSEQHHAYAEVMTTKQSDAGDISAQLIRLALSLCSGCDIHYKFRTIGLCCREQRGDVTSDLLSSEQQNSLDSRKTHKLKLGGGTSSLKMCGCICVFVCIHIC